VGVVDEISNHDVVFYIDGQSVGTASLSPGSGLLSSTYPMSIGARQGSQTSSYNDQFVGEMNDVAIFNYALSAAQVENEYVAGGGTNALYFNPQPPATGSAAANSTLTIPVTALGSPPLGFWWTNVTTGAGIASGITNNAGGDVTLSYPNVPLGWNGDQLQLTVTNAWGSTNVLFTLSITNGINANPTNLVFGVTNNQLSLTWPADHTGWQLQAQTNKLSVGISTNWVNVTGSTGTNQVTIPMNLTNGGVFYRLIY
jgi:concanavalin A-like lectin/glucanase superfamily protein